MPRDNRARKNQHTRLSKSCASSKETEAKEKVEYVCGGLFDGLDDGNNDDHEQDGDTDTNDDSHLGKKNLVCMRHCEIKLVTFMSFHLLDTRIQLEGTRGILF